MGHATTETSLARDLADSSQWRQNGNVPGFPGQRGGVRVAAWWLLRGGDDRRVDLLRHAGYRQHRASRRSSSSAPISPISLNRRSGSIRSWRASIVPAGYSTRWGPGSTRSTTLPSNGVARKRCAAWPSSSACCSSPRSRWSWCSASTTGWSTPSYIGPSLHLGPVDLPLRLLVPCLVGLFMVGGLQLFMSRTFIGRAILAVAQDQLALETDGGRSRRGSSASLSGFRSPPPRIAGAVADHHPAGRAIDRPRLHRPGVRDLRARRHGKLCRHAGGGDDSRRRREPDVDVLWAILVAGGRHSASCSSTLAVPALPASSGDSA